MRFIVAFSYSRSHIWTRKEEAKTKKRHNGSNKKGRKVLVDERKKKLVTAKIASLKVCWLRCNHSRRRRAALVGIFLYYTLSCPWCPSPAFFDAPRIRNCIKSIQMAQLWHIGHRMKNHHSHNCVCVRILHMPVVVVARHQLEHALTSHCAHTWLWWRWRWWRHTTMHTLISLL